MICQKCHKNLATIRYAEVIDGKVADLMICSGCYQAMQSGVSTGFEIAGDVPSPKRKTGALRQADAPSPQEYCRSCGRDLRETLKTGMAGCPECYKSFEESLNPMMRGSQVALRHRGKRPRHDNTDAHLREDLQKKRTLLRSALKVENYEEAAVLRDQIRSMEERIGVAGPSSS